MADRCLTAAPQASSCVCRSRQGCRSSRLRCTSQIGLRAGTRYCRLHLRHPHRQMPDRGLQLRCSSAEPGKQVSLPLGTSAQVGKEALAGVQEARNAMTWSKATVTENRNASADGTLRTLVLSVEDRVTLLQGRRMKQRQAEPRWLDAYTLPGQFIGLRYCSQEESSPAGADAVGGRAESSDSSRNETLENTTSGGRAQETQTAGRLFAIASSPYDARRESALLDASIIEVLVDRAGDADDRRLAALGPGSLLEVCQVMGRGYASLFNSYVGLMSALEDSHNLLLLACGARGIAPMRAAIDWTPIQAHATAHRVSLFYVAPSPASAAYLKDWDRWRDAGVRVEPLYLESLAGGASSNGNGGSAAGGSLSNALQGLLEEAVFKEPQGLMGAVGGDVRDCTALLSGLPGEVAAAVSRRLTAAGVARERVLFCDFF